MSMGAYHLARKSRNFGLKSNGKVIFRKFRSEIVEYLQRYSSFSVRNGTAEISVPFGKLSSFQSLISRKQLHEKGIANGKRHFIRLVCWFWKNPYHYSTVVPTSLFWQMVSIPYKQRKIQSGESNFFSNNTLIFKDHKEIDTRIESAIKKIQQTPFTITLLLINLRQHFLHTTFPRRNVIHVR